MRDLIFSLCCLVFLFLVSCSGVDPDNPLDPIHDTPLLEVRSGPFIEGGNTFTDLIASLTITHDVSPRPVLLWESRDGSTYTSRSFPSTTTTTGDSTTTSTGQSPARSLPTTRYSWTEADLTDADGETLTYYVKYQDSLGRQTSVYSDTIFGPPTLSGQPYIASGATEIDYFTYVPITHRVREFPVTVLESADGVSFQSQPIENPTLSPSGYYVFNTFFSWRTSHLADTDGRTLTYHAKYQDEAGRISIVASDTILGPVPTLAIASAGLLTMQWSPTKLAAVGRFRILFSGDSASSSLNLFAHENYALVTAASVSSTLVSGATAAIPAGSLRGTEKNLVHLYQRDFEYEFELAGSSFPNNLHVRLGDYHAKNLSPVVNIPLFGLRDLAAPTGVKIYIRQDSTGAAFEDDDQVGPVQLGGGGKSTTVPASEGNPASGPFRILVITDLTPIPDEVRLFQDNDNRFENGPGLMLTGSGTYHALTNPGFTPYGGVKSPIIWNVHATPYRTYFGVASVTFIHAQFRSFTEGLSPIVTVPYVDKTP